MSGEPTVGNRYFDYECPACGAANSTEAFDPFELDEIDCPACGAALAVSDPEVTFTLETKVTVPADAPKESP